MNERLAEGKRTKQRTFLPGNQVHQRGGVPWEILSASAEAESGWSIMLRDTLKTLKKRFWFSEGTRTQGKRGNKRQSVPFSEDRRASLGAKALLVTNSGSVRRPSTGRPGLRIWRRSESCNL